MPKAIFTRWVDCLTFGERLRWARLEKKMSQEQLATACGASQALISQCERGENALLGTARVMRAAAALDVSLTWLTDGVGTPYSEGEATLAKAIEVLKHNTPEELAALVAAAKSFQQSRQ
jgi:transcriptional regulator with XRE-family HTH domain